MRRTAYQEAVLALNALQSNMQQLQNFNKRSPEGLVRARRNLERTGIRVDELNKLNVIHVAGTKGKGSTCAIVESTLRSCGYRTGFYSSPHLIHVRERIRINGKPLSESVFTKYFWKLYGTLQTTGDDGDMPSYFQFLTLLAFHVFRAEQVDVAIVEVGLGGAYDVTNIIPRPVVCGITTLDLDHTAQLGNTIEEIAWQKAGIFKHGIPAFSSPQVAPAAEVLRQRAVELQASSLTFLGSPAPNSSMASAAGKLPGPGFQTNLPLAAQLAAEWIRFKEGHSTCQDGLLNSSLPSRFLSGVLSCSWPGRYHVINKYPITYFLDGAMTPKSLELCAQWFNGRSGSLSPTRNVCKVLIFNCTMGRKPGQLLPYLVDCDFDVVIFSPNCVSRYMDPSDDTTSMCMTAEANDARNEENRTAWLHCVEKHAFASNRGITMQVEQFGTIRYDSSDQGQQVIKTDSVSGAVDCVRSLLHEYSEHHPEPFDEVQVLVTGSLHLVGGMLTCIAPEEVK